MDSMYYIGLDIHKKTISYCVKEQNGIVCSEGTIPATRLTLDHWTDTLPQPWTAAMEATMFTGWVYDHLLPRRPRARANDSSSFIGAEIIWFQSTPPREGERLIVGTGVVVLLFQSTPPARVANSRPRCIAGVERVSIHAPARGRTPSFSFPMRAP